MKENKNRNRKLASRNKNRNRKLASTSIKTFEVYFSDLTEASQHYLCEAFKTSPEEENWESIPLAILDREVEEPASPKED